MMLYHWSSSVQSFLVWWTCTHYFTVTVNICIPTVLIHLHIIFLFLHKASCWILGTVTLFSAFMAWLHSFFLIFNSAVILSVVAPFTVISRCAVLIEQGRWFAFFQCLFSYCHVQLSLPPSRLQMALLFFFLIVVKHLHSTMQPIIQNSHILEMPT